MVSNVQAGHSGQIFLDNSDAWGHENSAVEGVSFAPVTFAANPDSPRTIMGGLAVLDTSFTATRTGIQIIGIYGICLLAAKKAGKKDHFAFGPFLCAGIVLAMLFGGPILDWYCAFL